MTSFDMPICLFQGHEAADLAEPQWKGTLWQFWEANQDSYRFGEIRSIHDVLRFAGVFPVGGGAQAAFTLMSERLRQERLAVARLS